MVGHEPTAQERDRYERVASVLLVRERVPVMNLEHIHQSTDKMTLCGSEVPQDRWRGRTAGSGMWTPDRESAIMEPLRDSAIPYG